MSLTGNLEVFPLEEVLRLLARSKKTGCLRVESGNVHGRTFITSGAVTLSTVGSDDELRRSLLNAGLVGEEELRRVELNNETLSQALAPGVSPGALTDFVREMTVESLFRIRRGGAGNFDFVVDLAPRYPTGQSFDPDVAVSEADRRGAEWTEIEAVIPDLHSPLKMVPTLPDDNNVTINPATWRVLAALEGGASVTQLADILGLSQFRAAREMAGLVRNRLVMVISAPTGVSPQPPPSVQESVPSELPDADEPPAEEDRPEGTVVDEPVVADSGGQVEPADWLEPSPGPEVAAAAVDAPAAAEPSGFWGETGPDSAQAGTAPAPVAPEAVEPAPTPEVPAASADQPAPSETDSWFTDEVAPAAGEDRTAGWWTTSTPADDEQASTGDPEADRFLESVFSQLTDEATETDGEKPEEETGFSMGLLRRRRLGAVAKETSDDEG